MTALSWKNCSQLHSVEKAPVSLAPLASYIPYVWTAHFEPDLGENSRGVAQFEVDPSV
jgi:hypothetical protein